MRTRELSEAPNVFSLTCISYESLPRMDKPRIERI